MAGTDSGVGSSGVPNLAPLAFGAAPWYDVQAAGYDVPGDGSPGSTALNNLIATIGADKATLLFRAGSYRIDANVTVPANITTMFLLGAAVNVDAGRTLTINGPFDAPVSRLFSGAGSVVFSRAVRAIYPEWWGAVSDVDSSSGTINAGTATLTTGGATFTPARVGQPIIVAGAGVAGALLITTIAAYVAPNQVTLAANAATSVVGRNTVWGTDSAPAIQKAINAAFAARGRVQVDGGFFAASALTISSSNGMAFICDPASGAIYGAVEDGAFLLEVLNCVDVEILVVLAALNGNGVRIGNVSSTSGNSLYNNILPGSRIYGPGKAASKPAVATGSVGILFSAAVSGAASYFHKVTDTLITGFDTLIRTEPDANAQVISDCQFEMYWYGVVFDSDENTLRGGFWHNSNGNSVVEYQEGFRIRLNRVFNSITDSMMEPGPFSMEYYIEAGASRNVVEPPRAATTIGFVDLSDGRNSNSDAATGKALGALNLAENRYHRVAEFTLPTAESGGIMDLQWYGYNTGAPGRASGRAIVAFDNSGGTIAAVILMQGTRSVGAGAPRLAGFEVSGQSIFAIVHVPSTGGATVGSFGGDFRGGGAFGSLIENVQDIGAAAPAYAAEISANIPSEGTFTVSLTGCTTVPTGTARGVRNGNVVTLHFPDIGGTSNSTNKTLTGLPSQYWPLTTKRSFCFLRDNTGAYVIRHYNIRTDGVIEFFYDINVGPASFTAAGVMEALSNSATYLIQ